MHARTSLTTTHHGHHVDGQSQKDERERVKKCGARVLSMDQISGMEPIHEDWGDVCLGACIASPETSPCIVKPPFFT